LVAYSEQLLARIGNHESQTEYRLKGEEDGEGSLLKSRELRSRKDFEGDYATNEGLEERRSKERAIAQDVVCFVVCY